MGGGEKALLALAGKTLLERAVVRLAPQVEGIAVNANREMAQYEAFGHPVLADTIDGHQGPLAGVLTGMRWAAREKATHVVTVAGDTPFFPETLVRDLEAALMPGAAIAMAAGPDGRHPTFALWPVDLADDLDTALRAGTRKIVAWADQHGVAKVDFPVEPYDPFFNVNTPEDMETAEAMAEAHAL